MVVNLPRVWVTTYKGFGGKIQEFSRLAFVSTDGVMAIVGDRIDKRFVLVRLVGFGVSFLTGEVGYV
jgi:hypothetical protein